MAKTEILEHLKSLKKKAETDFEKSLLLKNQQLIGSAIDRLNRIEKDIIEEERRVRLRVVENIKVDWNSPENNAIEDRRQYLIMQFENLTGKTIKEVLEEKTNK